MSSPSSVLSRLWMHAQKPAANGSAEGLQSSRAAGAEHHHMRSLAAAAAASPSYGTGSSTIVPPSEGRVHTFLHHSHTHTHVHMPGEDCHEALRHSSHRHTSHADTSTRGVYAALPEGPDSASPTDQRRRRPVQVFPELSCAQRVRARFVSFCRAVRDGNTVGTARACSAFAALIHTALLLLQGQMVKSLLLPEGEHRRTWNIIIFIFVLYNTLVIPLRVAFHEVWHDSHAEAAFLVCDYVGESLVGNAA